MARYLKSKKEILNDIRDIARRLTVDDLVSIMNIDVGLIIIGSDNNKNEHVKGRI